MSFVCCLLATLVTLARNLFEESQRAKTCSGSRQSWTATWTANLCRCLLGLWPLSDGRSCLQDCFGADETPVRVIHQPYLMLSQRLRNLTSGRIRYPTRPGSSHLSQDSDCSDKNHGVGISSREEGALRHDSLR